jgi:hypothetical protein
MDLRLIPMLAILYLLSFLDRGNIGSEFRLSYKACTGLQVLIVLVPSIMNPTR